MLSKAAVRDGGVIGPQYAHLGRDPVPLALARERSPGVYGWVRRMNAPLPGAGGYRALNTKLNQRVKREPGQLERVVEQAQDGVG